MDAMKLEIPTPHPGAYLREDVLPELGLSVGEFAQNLGMERTDLSALVDSRGPVSHDLAIRLGQALGTGARFWLALQLQYDVENTLPQKALEIHVEPLLGKEV